MTKYCSFCGKAEHEVFYIVEGPAKVGICDECIPLASDLVASQRARVARGEAIVHWLNLPANC